MARRPHHRHPGVRQQAPRHGTTASVPAAFVQDLALVLNNRRTEPGSVNRFTEPHSTLIDTEVATGLPSWSCPRGWTGCPPSWATRYSGALRHVHACTQIMFLRERCQWRAAD